jgi:hypothetical protein
MSLSAVSGSAGNPGGNPGSTFLPDVYRAQTWHKLIEMVQVQFSLGGKFGATILFSKALRNY